MKRSQAELLTNVVGDVPMGRLFRKFWMPVIHSERLSAGGAPMKVRMLGEDYAAFRSPDGSVGLIGEKCPHRGVSMLLARNEACGLRCIQHGWQIGASGKLVEAPNMPAAAALDRIPVNARPVVERHGMLWAWFGDAESAPPLTPYDFASLPEGHVDSAVAVGNCNWLQLLETLWDPFHVVVLHKSSLGNASGEGNAKTNYSRGVMDFGFEPTDYGFYFHALEKGTDIGIPFVLPSWSISMLGSKAEDDYVALGHIPIDNQKHLMWTVVFNPAHPLRPDGNGRKLLASIPARFDYRDDHTRANMWGQNRARMEANESFTGLDHEPTPYYVLLEDIATIESMGAVYDRSQEHLAPTDEVVVRGRNRLLDILKHMDAGHEPPGIRGEVAGALPTYKTVETT